MLGIVGAIAGIAAANSRRDHYGYYGHPGYGYGPPPGYYYGRPHYGYRW